MILYGDGISREGEIIEYGVDQGIIEKAGSWYSYGSDRIGQGKETVRAYLKENLEVAATIEAQIIGQETQKRRAHDISPLGKQAINGCTRILDTCLVAAHRETHIR